MKETEQLFYEENNILFNDFLKNYFFDDFISEHPAKQIELILLPECNLKCKYCYVNKYYHETYQNYDFENSKNNLIKILNYYEDNHFKCNLDIFSGELLAQKDGYKFLDIIYNFFKDKQYKPCNISIPTNYTFILSDEYTKKVQNIIDNFHNIGINLYLSASFDGKYMEQNRPFRKDLDISLMKDRDDDYYNKVFEFNSKNDFGFHPMVYNEGIEKWIDNFNWFQDMFKKFDIDWYNIYLLQVRNTGWTKKQNQELYKFLRFLIDFTYDKFDNKKDFINFILTKGYNILSAPFYKIDRGLPCAIQSSLPIRINDMKMFPCHRLMYPDLEIGQLVFNQEQLIKTKNAELGLTIYGVNNNYFPICNKCPVRNLCSKGCLGSQFEVNNDLFTPIPSVCNNYYYLLKALVDGYESKKVLDDILNIVNCKEKQTNINFLRSIDIDI